MKKTILQRDKEFVWHPFTPQKDRQPPIAITSGKESLLIDEKGNSYIDAVSSWWVTLHGHANAFIAEKIYQQALTLEQVIFAGFTHEPAVSLAEKLIGILPGNMSKIFYSDNGSTSTEVAIKMSIQYWWNKEEKQRTKILAFHDSYHGDTFGAMSVSDRSVFTLAFQDKLFEVIFIDTPTAENIEAIKEKLSLQAYEIAAFIYEPLVQGAGGMKMYDAAQMQKLLAFLKDREIICIADEVMTGFGRTGKLFASSYMVSPPDIICLSKGLTGGTMALGVTACNKKIYEAFLSDDKLKTFFHGHSFTANPLACTAALASLELLKQKSCTEKMDWICTQNKRLAEKLKDIAVYKNVRITGTILAFEINKGEDAYLNSVSSGITNFCLQQGVYIRPLGNTVYIMPPYCITEAEFEKIEKVLEMIAEL